VIVSKRRAGRIWTRGFDEGYHNIVSIGWAMEKDELISYTGNGVGRAESMNRGRLNRKMRNFYSTELDSWLEGWIILMVGGGANFKGSARCRSAVIKSREDNPQPESRDVIIMSTAPKKEEKRCHSPKGHAKKRARRRKKRAPTP